MFRNLPGPLPAFITTRDFRPWNEKERNALTRFILSLRYRHPEGVREIWAHMHDLHVAGMDGLREHYAQWRQPQHPPTLAEYVARHWPERGS